MKSYIGTSLGKCLCSILKGEVSEDEVFLIVTGTRAPTMTEYLAVVGEYYYKRYGSSYDLTLWEPDTVQELAMRLWNAGKIHQPRNFGAQPGFYQPLWIEIIPPHLLNQPAVKNLYNQIVMVSRLVE
jgi:hypothetical protein